ncbi:MAG: hypothetical protein PHN37_02605 [Candidatus Pacebacteria bacterium]|nr:hypothetical protein [Candidatus Paceibacterota bacterium]
MKKLFLLILIVLLPVFVSAGLVPCGGPGQDPCNICHLFVLANNIVRFLLFNLLPILIPLMIVAGGVVLIIAYVDPSKGPENIQKARAIFKTVIIGTILVYTAWIIVNLFFQVLGIIEWRGFNRDGWWHIECSHDLSNIYTLNYNLPS